jgi:nucleoside-diphosphate-sugar epimerase
VKVFVTGTNGFIGSSLVKKLLEKNHEVYGLVRYISNRSPNLPKDVNIVYGDIRDFLLIKKTIKDIQPEAVFTSAP